MTGVEIRLSNATEAYNLCNIRVRRRQKTGKSLGVIVPTYRNETLLQFLQITKLHKYRVALIARRESSRSRDNHMTITRTRHVTVCDPISF